MRISRTLAFILVLLLALSAFSGCETNKETTAPTTDDDTNYPPSSPVITYPYDGAESMSIRPTLMWTCSDLDGDELRFDWRITTYPTPSTIFSGYESTEYSHVWNSEGTPLEPETEYVLIVYANDGTNDLVESTPRTFTTGTGLNNPPSRPLLNPYDDEIDVDPEALRLTWYCFDPDGDPVVYDVQFGEPPVMTVVSEGQTERSYDIGTLEYGKSYWWDIVARDDQGGRTISFIHDFTTEEANNPPEVPSATYPVDDEPAASLETTLSWTCTDPDGDPLTYDVWFGPPLMELPVATGISETFVNLEGLRRNTEYSWSVTAYDNDGGETDGPFWRFTTANEVYTEIEVIRTISNYYGSVTQDDMMKARFDAAYAPDAAIEALQPYAVKGGPYTLEWLSYEQIYFYRDPQNDPFLTLGSTYTFVVSNDAEINYLQVDVEMPDCEQYFTSPNYLQVDVEMPDCEQYFTSPDMNTGVSLSGFTVEWYSSCPGTGDVDLYVRDGMGESININVPNNGSYTFASGQLSSFSGSFELFVDIVTEEWYPIDEIGYYQKSFWRGKVTSTLMLYVM